MPRNDKFSVCSWGSRAERRTQRRELGSLEVGLGIEPRGTGRRGPTKNGEAFPFRAAEVSALGLRTTAHDRLRASSSDGVERRIVDRVESVHTQFVKWARESRCETALVGQRHALVPGLQ